MVKEKCIIERQNSQRGRYYLKLIVSQYVFICVSETALLMYNKYIDWFFCWKGQIQHKYIYRNIFRTTPAFLKTRNARNISM